MSIERINMAVPVAKPAADDQGLVSEVAHENAVLNGMIAEFTELLTERSKVTWGRERVMQRREKFDVRTRGLIKKFASVVAELADDRAARRRVRMRIYSDLVLTLQTATAKHDAQQDRRNILNRRLWLASLGLIPISGLAIYSVVVQLTGSG